MAAPPEDKRPPVAVAMEWVSRITTVALTMVLPAGLGYSVDQRWGTAPWLLVVGACGGLVLGVMQLLSMVDGSKSTRARRSRDRTS